MEQQDLIRFKQIVRHLLANGEKLANVIKKSGLTGPTIDAIMKDKEQKFRASTLAAIQDFNKFYSLSGIDFCNKKEKVSKKEEVSYDEVKSETADKVVEDEPDNYGELNFLVKMKELLCCVPSSLKVIITIEKK